MAAAAGGAGRAPQREDSLDHILGKDDLDGVVVTRVPFSMPDFKTGLRVPSIQFHAKSSKPAPYRLTLTFSGDNLSVRARSGQPCGQRPPTLAAGADVFAAAPSAPHARGAPPQLEPLGPMALTAPLAVTGIIPRLAKTALCALGPADPEKSMQFSVKMELTPAGPSPETVSELAGSYARP